MRTFVSGMVALVWLSMTFLAYAEAEKDLWLTDFEQAKKTAVAKKVPILVNFTGSDWCGWCMRLDKEVFSREAFKSYSKESLVLLKIDFPRKIKLPDGTVAANGKLADQFGIQGFPTIVLLDAEGKEITRTSYRQGGAEAYVDHLKALLAK